MRVKQIQETILDVAKRQIAASPQAQVLDALVPGALDNLVAHIASNAAMVLDAQLESEPDQYERATLVAAEDHKVTP
ncbi:MAG: hypothetical protein ACREJC_19135 [Tepidisphaeraceae bacterium]